MNEADRNRGLRERLDELTASRLRELRAKSDKRRKRARRPALARQERVGTVPLSYEQERLWFLDKLGFVGSAYNMAMTLRIEGVLDVALLERSFSEVIRRHEVLRTHFESTVSGPVQVVAPDSTFQLEKRDLAESTETERVEQVKLATHTEESRPFDLGKGPLLRALLLRLAPQEHVLLLTVHHIVFDAWSRGVLHRELAEIYSAFARGETATLADPSIQYADYAIWQRRWLQGELLQEHLQYWKDRIAGAPPSLEIPTDRPRPSVESFRGAERICQWPAALSGGLKELARREGATVFMVVLAAYQTLLARWSGQEDVVVGTPIAGRGSQDTERLVGFFVNTLALRTDLSGNPSFRELIVRVKEVTISAYAHPDLPFDVLVRELRPERNLSRQPIFQVAIAQESASEEEAQPPGQTWKWGDGERSTTHFDLTLYVYETPGGISAGIEYATDLFDEQTIERMDRHLRMILEGAVANPDCAIQQLPMLADQDRREVIEAFNETKVDYPRDRSIHEIFEELVRRTPGAPAVAYEGKVLTYAEVNAAANRLAHALIDSGMAAGEFVPIVMPRSLQMLVAQIAVLKAGGTYLPLDPILPVERRAFMIRDCGARRVISEERWRDGSQETSIQWIEYSRCTEPAGKSTDPGLRLDRLPPAYVMYTSGSTGVPKGVVVPHRGILRLVIGSHYAQIRPEDRVAHCSNPAFDASTLEIWGPLLNGASIIIVPQEVMLDAQRFSDFLIEQQVNVLWMTIGLLTQYADALAPAFGKLRYLMTGGDVVDPEVIRRVLRKSPPKFLLSAYGPTECTTFSTTYLIESLDSSTKSIPIGKPISNSRVYILDRFLQPVPIGVPGEMYIGGDGVALEYLGRPELTVKSFLTDPFSSDPDARMYKSGDLARWCADGNLEFLGRNDHQVKIRGFRIELGEIEAQLKHHDRVHDALVLARKDSAGNKRLVAYVSREGEVEPTVDELRAYLTVELPEYMVPSAFVVLERFPLTASGKVDRQALPEPDLGAYASREYEAPQGNVETVLAGIWQELLHVERVGRQDNFFELGGHSLLIVQMLERLRRVGLSAEVRRVFESPRLAALAQAVEHEPTVQAVVPANLIPADCAVITPEMLPLVELEQKHIAQIMEQVPGGVGNVQDIYPLTPLQEGMLFHHMLDHEGGDKYLVTTVLSVSRREQAEDLIAALQGVVNRHDMLRTAVLWEGLPQPVQVVYRRAVLPVDEIALDGGRDALEQIKERIQPELQRMDLRRAPLMRVQLAADPAGSQWYVLLQIHHLADDGRSRRILVSEVISYLEGRQTTLQPPAPYRNHVAQALAPGRTQDAEEFFRRKLGDIEELTAPFGLLNAQGDGPNAGVSQEIDLSLAQRLRAQARRMSVSVATFFHAAWALVVARTSGRDDVVFGSVLLGRLQGSAGAQQAIGMFLNTLPLRLRLRDLTARELVEQTQRELMELLGYEQASLAVAQRCSGIAGSAPLFTALLNYRHGVADSEVEWSDLPGVRMVAHQYRSDYPLSLSVDDEGEGFVLGVRADGSIDPNRIVAYVHTAIQSLTEALESASATPVQALSVMPMVERQQVIESFNATRAPYPQDRLITDVFEEQVQRTPGALAVVHNGKSLTYAELNSRANQLARFLRSRGIGRDQLVGICVDRGLEMVVGMLGILKAGGAYVPLDPNYPADRLAYMLEGAAPRVLLIQEALKERLPRTGAEVVSLDTDWTRIAELPRDNLGVPDASSGAGQLAYMIYTSGSTGQPKGVMIEHRHVLGLWQSLEHIYRETTGCQHIAVNAPFNFDGSVKQFIQLLSGRTLFLMDQETRLDSYKMLEFMEQSRIHGIDCTPSQLKEWVAEGLLEREESPLRLVLVGGEAIDPQLWERLARCQRIEFYNVYGPTECTVDATFARLRADNGPPHIGRSMENKRAYILDGHRQPVPIGVTGELYIGGAGVARGYLNRPELTQERFLTDPFVNDAGARMYRTGDLVRWRVDGTIEYVGRNDHQVKVRGFRIELGEIEAALLSHQAVKQAVVLAQQDSTGGSRLAGYVAVDAIDPLENGFRQQFILQLREYLGQRLPDYMVPSSWLILEQLPLTPNGKVDRRALPVLQDSPAQAREYVAPRTPIERVLAEVWAQLLGIDQVGIHDSFFELGGHSLHVMRLVGRVAERLGVRMPVVSVYQNQTVEEMANFVSSLRSVREAAVTSDEVEFEEGAV